MFMNINIGGKGGSVTRTVCRMSVYFTLTGISEPLSPQSLTVHLYVTLVLHITYYNNLKGNGAL